MNARACVRTNIINLRRKIKCVLSGRLVLMPLATVHRECRNIFYAYKDRDTLQRQKKTPCASQSHALSGIVKGFALEPRVHTYLQSFLFTFLLILRFFVCERWVEVQLLCITNEFYGLKVNSHFEKMYVICVYCMYTQKEIQPSIRIAIREICRHCDVVLGVWESSYT